MDALSSLSNLSLAASVVFAVLVGVVPKGSRYETVELDVVSTRKVLAVIAAVCFVGWLFLSLGIQRPG